MAGNCAFTISFICFQFYFFFTFYTVRTGHVTKNFHDAASLLSCWLILLVITLAPSAVSALLNSFSVFVWTGENDLKTLRVDANLFENGEKNLRFQVKTDTCGRGLSFRRKKLISDCRILDDGSHLC